MRSVLFVLAAAGAAAMAQAPIEKAAYDSTGRIISMIAGGEELEVSSSLVAVLPTGKRIPIQVRRERQPVSREGEKLVWNGSFELPDGGRGRYRLASDESGSGVAYSAAVTADSPLEVDAIDLVLDLPRKTFLNARVEPAGIVIPAVKPADPVFYRGEAQSLRIAAEEWTLEAGFDKARSVTLADRWDLWGRSYQLRVAVARGPLERNAESSVVATLSAAVKQAPPAPVKISVDAAKPLYRFDGFGGNYCWSNDSPVSAYTLENLKIAWARFELKLLQWDKQRDNPTAAIRKDLETMGRVQKMGVPYVVSIWWLPERVYSDPYEKPRNAHFRRIAPDKWDDALDLVSSYLLYAKNEYQVEPDLFSFNEANIGIYVGFDPEDHAQAIKKFGEHFKKLGLKTRMLLGDATGPRGTHTYVLAAGPRSPT